MKGKLIYTTVVEKEIEIPDEVIEAFDKTATDWDSDAYALIDEFSANAWESVDNVDNHLAIEFERDGFWWPLEEY